MVEWDEYHGSNGERGHSVARRWMLVAVDAPPLGPASLISANQSEQSPRLDDKAQPSVDHCGGLVAESLFDESASQARCLGVAT